MRRSGTNYLSHLLRLHPDIQPIPPIYEDFIIHHSDLLVNYSDNLYNWWLQWEPDTIAKSSDSLLMYFGTAIKNLLLPKDERENKISMDDNSSVLEKCYLLKTPSIVGIENFFRIFPDQPLIIIVRNGRSVVESGMRSFDWRFEKASQEWALAAQKIIQVTNNWDHEEHKFVVIRYEDIFTNPKNELSRIFSFFNFYYECYDFDAAEILNVIGSSEFKNKMNKVDWRPVKKPQYFNPLTRWEHWPRSRHEIFNWIAGEYMKHFGYVQMKAENYRVFYDIWNKGLDRFFHLRVVIKGIFSVFKRAWKLFSNKK